LISTAKVRPLRPWRPRRCPGSPPKATFPIAGGLTSRYRPAPTGYVALVVLGVRHNGDLGVVAGLSQEGHKPLDVLPLKSCRPKFRADHDSTPQAPGADTSPRDAHDAPPFKRVVGKRVEDRAVAHALFGQCHYSNEA
jgi:hypothetical protein